MLENQFVKWFDEVEQDKGKIALPMPFDAVWEVYLYYAEQIAPVAVDGSSIGAVDAELEWSHNFENHRIIMSQWEDVVKPGQMFRFRVINDDDEVLYSNVFYRPEAHYDHIDERTTRVLSTGTGGGETYLRFSIAIDRAGMQRFRITSAAQIIDFEDLKVGGSYVKAEYEQTDAHTGFVDFYAANGSKVISIAMIFGGVGSVTVDQIFKKEDVWTGDSHDGISLLKYKCNEDAFGIPFASSPGYVSQYLPILARHPQYSQSDKTYTKMDGSIVTLYSQARKEWDGETEYLPEEIHDKIMVALMCDEVYIDGERVSKSGSYDVDWDNFDTLCDGTKIAKATFKVQSNMVSRNSNY